jgi:putative membrane protein
MTRWNQIALALCVAAATTACAGDRAPEGTRADDPSAVGTAGRGVNADADREFVEDMIAGGNAEVELGRLVEDKSKNREVRQFAAMLVEDHTKAGADLKQVATTANIETMPADANAADAHNDMMERLGKLSGAEFDREYIKAMVDKHEKTVDSVEEKADGPSNDHVKQWAAKTLPTLKKHLEQAKQIQENLEKPGA